LADSAASGTISLELDSAAEADVVEAALAPEMGADVPGSRVAMRREGTTLLLDIEAEDAGALRAAVNSYLRWMKTALDVHAVAQRGR
jgi:tRNA threonylcarbamoyladenosine modification (KEOPS) complex  Pcc1 subunit